MTILNNGTRNQYTATASQTVFAYNFEILAEGDLVVYKNTTLLSLGVDYTVAGAGNENGGSITLTTGATAGDTLTLYRDTAPERLTDFQNSGDFLAQEINAEQDRQWAVLQEQKSNQDRYLQVSTVTEQALPVILEDGNPNQYLRWDASASSIENVAINSISPTSVTATDLALHKADYVELRATPAAERYDGRAVVVTNDGIGGNFVLRNSAGHGLTDNGGTIIVIDSDWYAERVLEVEDTYNPVWFGADPSGTTDSYLAFQTILDIRPNSAGSYAPSKLDGGEGRVRMSIPTGTYLLSSFLDCSQRDYVTIVGEGRAVLRPTHSGYCIDMTSADHCTIKNIRIFSDNDDCSIGIYLNRATTNPFAQFNHFEDIEIVLGTRTTANYNLGTVGIFNCRAEQNQFKNVVIRADLPYLARATHSSIQPQANCTQDTTIASCSVVIYEQVNFIKNGPYTFCMKLAGCLEHEFQNCYWGSAALNSGSNVYAVEFDGISSCKFTGSNETNARFGFIMQDNFNNDVRIAQQLSAVDAGGIMNLDNTGAVSGFLNGYISVLVAGGTPVAGACIFKDSDTATTAKVVGTTIVTTSLMNTITSVSADGVNNRQFRYNIEQRDNQLKITHPVIRFSPSQITSSDANTLDDYEEGTFTPRIDGTSSSGSGTYINNVGFYTKIGDLVNFSLFLNWSAHTGAGNMIIENLPFTSSSIANSSSPCSIRPNNIACSAGSHIAGYVAPNSTSIILEEYPTGGGAINSLALDISGSIMVSGHYKV